jgi:hypothetical protein
MNDEESTDQSHNWFDKKSRNFYILETSAARSQVNEL